MILKEGLEKMLSNFPQLKGKSTNEFEVPEAFLRPRLKKLVASLQDDVLRNIPVNPVVAGGFLRDTILGAHPKDLDIFIKFDEALDEFDRDYYKGLIRERVSDGGDDEDEAVRQFYGAVDLTGPYGEREGGEELLDGVLEFYSEQFAIKSKDMPTTAWVPPPIQLIAHRSEPDELLDRFDLGICKVAYLPHEDNFIYTPEFIADVKNKAVTLDKRYENNETSQRRKYRIERKLNREVWNKPEAIKTSVSTKDMERFRIRLQADNARIEPPVINANNDWIVFNDRIAVE